MTTFIHPRRALAESEAQAWLDLHSDWATGLPAEVRDTSIRGELFHDHLGDGWDTLWWHSTASDRAAPAARTTSTVPQCSVDSDYDASLPTIERRQVQTGRLGDYGVQPAAPSRIVAQAGTQELRPVTVVLGDRVPGSMTYDRRTDSGRRRCVTRPWRSQFPPTAGCAAGLRRAGELVATGAGCTDREIEALERLLVSLFRTATALHGLGAVRAALA